MKHLGRLLALGALGAAAGLFGTSVAGGSPALQEVSIDCRVRANDDGCEAQVRCPSGAKLRGAKVACNLEHGAVTDEQLANVPGGYLEVVRPSDRVDEGECWLGEDRSESGLVLVTKALGATELVAGCREHDRNGGDCHVRGVVYCQ